MDNSTVPRRYGPKKHFPFEDLPNQARRLRLAMGLPLREAAAQIGVTSSTLQQFELAGTGISTRRRYKLADVLRTDIPTLLTPGKKFEEKVRQMID